MPLCNSKMASSRPLLGLCSDYQSVQSFSGSWLMSSFSKIDTFRTSYWCFFLAYIHYQPLCVSWFLPPADAMNYEYVKKTYVFSVYLIHHNLNFPLFWNIVKSIRSNKVKPRWFQKTTILGWNLLIICNTLYNLMNVKFSVLVLLKTYPNLAALQSIKSGRLHFKNTRIKKYLSCKATDD